MTPNLPARRPAAPLAPGAAAGVPQLVAAFLAGRNDRTLRAYGECLDDFARFSGAPTRNAAVESFLALPHGHANAAALAYRTHLQARGLSAATINHRLAALRSLVKLARTVGQVAWTLDVAGMKAKRYRDTRGPGRVGFMAMLGVASAREDAKGARDRAILRLLYDLALRRAEVVALDLADVALEAGRLSIMGKGRTEPETYTVPAPTLAALRAWIRHRGDWPGALFVSLDRARHGQRLTGRSVHRIVAAIGKGAGLDVRPHGLRHAAITDALDRTNGNVRAVQKFSRHRDLRTLTEYDDNRLDLAGDIARQVAEGAP
jgi:integrase/recombinase XerC